MSLDHLFPFAGNHAIQNAVFAIDFAQPLTDDNIKDVKKAAVKAFGQEFEPPVDQQTLAVNLALAGKAQNLQTSVQSGGFAMQQSVSFAGIPRRIVSVSPGNCMVVINDYTRWDEISDAFNRYFDAILKVVGAAPIPVSGIGLQYSDLFNWKADAEELNLKEVFREGSLFLVPHMLSDKPPLLWHSHHGYFEDVDSPIKNRQLNNINVNRASVNEVDSIQVLTSHRAQLEKPLYQVGIANRKKISDVFELLHKKNKQMLQALLSDEVLAKIDLL